MGRIYVAGTADTKGAELAFLAARVVDAGGAPLVVDLGTRAAAVPVDIPAAEVAAHHPAGAPVLGDDRGAAVTAMGEAFAAFVRTRTDIAGIVGIGGGGGTSIVTAGMRALPFGLPKLMVSTLASGDVGPYVGVSDITMMHSVADIAGLNRITRTVLAQAAHAVVGMTRAPAAADARPAVGLTMFGVTTACVTRVAAPPRRPRPADLPRHRHRRPGDGGPRRQRHARGPDRRHHHRGRRPPLRRRAQRRPRPPRRRRPLADPLRRLLRRPRHGQLLGARDRPRPLRPPPASTATTRTSR